MNLRLLLSLAFGRRKRRVLVSLQLSSGSRSHYSLQLLFLLLLLERLLLRRRVRELELLARSLESSLLGYPLKLWRHLASL